MNLRSGKVYVVPEAPKVMMQYPNLNNTQQQINMYLDRAKQYERSGNTYFAIIDYRYILLLDPGNMIARSALYYLLAEQFLI